MKTTKNRKNKLKVKITRVVSLELFLYSHKDRLLILSSSSFSLAHLSLSFPSILMFSLIWTWMAFIGVVCLSSRGEVLIFSISTSWAIEKEEEERIKSLPTYHIVATIQVVEDAQTVSTHHTPSPTGPINGDATTSTIEEETSMN